MNVAKSIGKVKTVQAVSKTKMNISEFALFILALMVWTRYLILGYARAAFMRVPLLGAFVDEIIAFAYIIFVCLALPAIFKKLKVADVIFGVIVITVCLSNFILFPQNEAVLNEHLSNFIINVFPLYYIGISIDFKRIYPWIRALSIATVFAFTVYKLFFVSSVDDANSIYAGGDMDGSYKLLPHVCVVILAAFNQKGILNVIVNTITSVVGVLMLFSLGSRGPILCLVIMLIVFLMFFKKYKHPVLARVVIVCIAAAVLIQLDSIMAVLQNFAESIGLSTRIFDKYFEGTVTDSTGRDAISEALLSMISSQPVLGAGLYADRAALGTYAHNIIIEFWVSFGIFIGTGLFLALILLFIKTIRRLPKSGEQILILLPLFVTGFIKLFMSASFMDEIYLFLLIGFCTNVIRTRFVF